MRDPERPGWGRPLPEEWAQHLDDRYAELRAGGAGHDEARRLALAELGEPQPIPAPPRSPLALLAGLRSEVVRALRQHRHTLPTAAAVILTLTLGIGAGTSVFSVVNALFLEPLPYPNAERVRVIWEDGTARGDDPVSDVSGANFLDWRERNRTFSALAAVRNITRTFTELPPPNSPLFHAVTANFFDVLGNRPLLGRTFRPGEDAGQGASVVILSYGAWQSRFAGDPAIVGRRVTLDGAAHEIIGVMPRGFLVMNSFATQPDAWIPLPIETFRQERGIRRFLIAGHLREGVTTQQAQADLSRVAADLAAEFPETNERWGVAVMTVREQLVGRAEWPLRLIVVGAGALLLIAVCNVISLLLAAGTARVREMAARTALGAPAWQIVRQLLVEAGLLAAAGAALGMLISGPITRYMVSLIPPATNIAFLDTIRPGLRVTLFAGGCALLAAVLCALVTARQALRIGVVAELSRRSNRSVTEGRGERRMRDGLVIAQVALSVMLLLAAGLMVQTLRNLAAFRGFDAANLMMVNASVRGPTYQSADARAGFFREAATRIAALPGVVSASVTSSVPPTSSFQTARFSIDDRAAAGETLAAPLVMVHPGYTETMRIPLVAGRTVAAFDTPQSEPVVVISRELARRHFDGVDPVGRTLLVDTGIRKARRVIVGVVDDVRSQPPDPRPQPVIYLPHTQAPTPDMAFVIRLEDGRAMPLAQIRRVLRAIDPTVPSFNAALMDDVLGSADWLARFVAGLLSLFTFVGLALVAAGVYGGLAFVVAMRRREFGLHLALGAPPPRIARLVVGGAARVVAAGAVAGIIGFLVLGRAIDAMLFGVTRTDAATVAGVLGVVTVVTAVVAVSPLRQALRVDPLIVMKTE